MTASNPKPHEPRVPTAELLAAYADHSKVLRRTDRALCEEQIQLEADGASPDPAPVITDDAPEQRARELLNGFAPPMSAKTAAGRLFQVMNERKAITIALNLLQSTELQTRAVALAEWLRDGGEDRWIASRRRLADALLSVRAAVDEARAIRTEAMMVAGGQQVALPGDRGDKSLIGADAQQVLEVTGAEPGAAATSGGLSAAADEVW